MSVYVGIDVHRKRSQVAVIDQGGEVLANRNVPNGVGADPGRDRRLAAGHAGGVRGGVRLGVAGGAAGGLRLRPAPGAPAAVQGDRLGRLKNDKVDAAILAPAAARRPAARGVDRAARGAPAAGAAAAPHPAGAAADAAAQPDPRRPRRPRPRPAGGLLERPGPGLARLAAAASRLPRGDRGRPGADRRPAAAGRPARLGAAPAGQARPAGEGLDPAPGRRAVHRAGHPRRGRRDQPVRLGPQARRLGRAHPHRPRHDRTVRHGHISGQGSAWLRWILCQAAQTAKRHPDFAASYQAIARRRGKKIATTAIARKLLTRAWHLLTDAERAAAATSSHDSASPPRDAVTNREGPPSPGRARISA